MTTEDKRQDKSGGKCLAQSQTGVSFSLADSVNTKVLSLVWSSWAETETRDSVDNIAVVVVVVHVMPGKMM